MSEDEPKRSISTVPPPKGEDDLYSASTVVGPASAELLALVRAAEEGTLDAKLAEQRAAEKARREANQSASVPAPARPPPGMAATRSDAAATSRRPASVEQPRTSGGLPPAIGILFWFATATILLAALVR